MRSDERWLRDMAVRGANGEDGGVSVSVSVRCGVCGLMGGAAAPTSAVAGLPLVGQWSRAQLRRRGGCAHAWLTADGGAVLVGCCPVRRCSHAIPPPHRPTVPSHVTVPLPLSSATSSTLLQRSVPLHPPSTLPPRPQRDQAHRITAPCGCRFPSPHLSYLLSPYTSPHAYHDVLAVLPAVRRGAGQQLRRSGAADAAAGVVRVPLPPARGVGHLRPVRHLFLALPPLGQLIVGALGQGLVTEWGGQPKPIGSGDVAWISPDTRHWHGAQGGGSFTQLAITESEDDRTIEWLARATRSSPCVVGEAAGATQWGLIVAITRALLVRALLACA